MPTSYRTHRRIPPLYALHHEDVAEADRDSFEGIPIVSAAKAIRQAHQQHLRPSLLEQAIDDGLRTGWLCRRDTDQLRIEILGETAR